VRTVVMHNAAAALKLPAAEATVEGVAKACGTSMAAGAQSICHNFQSTYASAYRIDLARPEVFIGGLLGAMLIFLFSSLAIRAVSKAAQSVIKNVTDQFDKDPGILAGTSKPDYRQCVDLVTVGALKQMVLPGILAVCMPIAVGLIFKMFRTQENPLTGAQATGALLMVGTIAGILLATVLNNGGGAWDNAKKYIETGALGGKRSEAHKAAVVGDTVGDPFKDTAGPSIHVLIKLLSTITLVLAPLFI
jgi:K(+)-stimulated pyrophosphate-energized sodium pump